MQREHLVIRREDYVAGTRERPEVGIFTQTHSARPPVPWGKIGAGEKVWMKWTGGPVVAVATVTGFRQFDHCTPDVLRGRPDEARQPPDRVFRVQPRQGLISDMMRTARAYQEPSIVQRGGAMKTPLRQGEHVIREGAANLQRGIEAVGGRLYLTNQRIVFESHAFNIQVGATEIDLLSIRGTRPCWTKLLGLVPLFPNSLAVAAGDGEYKFVLAGRASWADAIQGAMASRT